MKAGELKKVLNSGLEKIRPLIEVMTNTIRCYQQGFKDCWKVLTGKEF